MSTESIPLKGNADDLLVKFLRSGFIGDGRRAVIHFRVRLGAGKHEAGRLHRAHHGVTMVSGDASEIVNGTVSCPGFASRKWATGVFPDFEDVALS